MDSNPLFSGSLVALVSPMHADGTLDWDCLRRLIDWHVEAGTDGIIAVGTTGESPTLDLNEHEKVIAITIEHTAGRIPVIAGTGANSTAEAIRLTKRACTDGADACLSVVPYYNKPTQAGLLAHFTAIADVAEKPLVLYNVPSRTITDLANDSVATLSQHPRIGGIKDATGDLARLAWQHEHIDADGFCYLSGDDLSCYAYVRAGGHGVISVTANVAPKMMHELIVATRNGDDDVADALNAKLVAFNQLQGVVPNPMPVKWALYDQGRIGPGLRLPMTPLPKQHHTAVHDATRKLH